MNPYRELWIEVLLTYFEDLEENFKSPSEHTRSQVIDLLFEAFHPWTKKVCSFVDIDHSEFYRAVARKAKQSMERTGSK